MLESFFHRHSGKRAYCAECGRPLYNTNPTEIAHILPKGIFKSVATNDNNFLYLCFTHHSQFDMSWKKAMGMKCWPKAIEKFKLFEHEVQENHKILNYFKT